MDSNLNINDDIKSKIFTIRGLQVMIDRDLAELYGVETRALNQAVKRNIDRFPNDFMFQLSIDEWQDFQRSQNVKLKNSNLISQNVTSSSHGGMRKLPYVFTEQGVAGLSGVLKSKTAAKIHVEIMRAFVSMRKFLMDNASIFQRLDKIEYKLLENDHKFEQIFTALDSKKLAPTQGIFFDGQIFDAYNFVADLIRSAKNSIILFDNYVDDSVLTLFGKRSQNVKVKIFTKKISVQLKLDLQKFNSQYEAIEIIEFADSHDRFLLLDNEELYHFGASLKDLGKKWFAFSKMDNNLTKVFKEFQS